MGLLESLGHLKNPYSSPFGHSPPHSARAAYSAILSLYISMYIELFLYLYMHCPIMYVCVLAEYSIKEEDFRCAFPIILRLKRMHFTKSKTNAREKQIKVNLLKTYFGF